MTNTQMGQYRTQLEALAGRVRGTAAGIEEQVRASTGGEAAGGLSNAPMHLADIGSETYTQELNATLLENETFLRDEVDAALDRLDAGTFGTCEGCGTAIPAERLEALPYARHCVRCAESAQSGAAVNLNAGRPGATTAMGGGDDPDDGDSHAAGTPGGGTAVGGLAGTTVGRGDPSDARLESAMGSGNFDAAEPDDDGEEGMQGYGGSAGGAVGGTPANKRAVGGKGKGGLAPQPGKGDSPTGQ